MQFLMGLFKGWKIRNIKYLYSLEYGGFFFNIGEKKNELVYIQL